MTCAWRSKRVTASIEDRDDAGRRGARADHSQRQARDGEAARGQSGQVEEALDLRVREIALMRGPEDARLATLERIRRLPIERPVPAPGIDAHDADAPLEQPSRRRRRDPWSSQHVVGLVVEA